MLSALMIRAASTSIWARAIFLLIFCVAACQLSDALTLVPGKRAPPN